MDFLIIMYVMQLLIILVIFGVVAMLAWVWHLIGRIVDDIGDDDVEEVDSGR